MRIRKAIAALAVAASSLLVAACGSSTTQQAGTQSINASGKPVSAFSTFLGYWGVHDGTLCIGTALSLGRPGSKIPRNLPCNGTSSWGYTSVWGCSTPTPSLPSVCNQFYAVHFTSNPDGSIIATIAGRPIYVADNGQIVKPSKHYWQAFTLGDKFMLVHIATGLLRATYSDGSQGYWCNYNTISAANRPKCGA